MKTTRYQSQVVIRAYFGPERVVSYGTWRWLRLAAFIARMGARYQDYFVVPTHYYADGRREETEFEIRWRVEEIET